VFRGTSGFAIHRIARLLVASLMLTGATIGAALTVAAQTAAAAPGFGVGTVFVSDVTNNQVVELPAGGGAASTIASGLARPSGLAVDGAGDVFVADGNNDRVVEIQPGGAQTTIATGLSTPYDVDVDRAGDVFVADSGNDRVVEFPVGGGPPTTVASSLAFPTSVAVDSAGDVFVVEAALNRVIEVPAGGGPNTVVGAVSGAFDVAVDTSGNVYIAAPLGNAIYKVPAGNGTPVAIAIGLSDPTSVALDAAGNVYAADSQNGGVLVIPAGGGPATTLASGLGTTFGVAVWAPPPTFTADTPPASGTVGSPYTYTYTANTPVREPAAKFALVSGTLPPGLTLNPTTGELSGQPTTVGTFQFRVQTANAATASVSPLTTIQIQLAQQVQFTSTPPRDPVVGDTYQVTASGGGSGNPVVLSIDPSSPSGACAINSSGLVTFTGAGTCIITADQAGDATHAAAPQSRQSIDIAKAAQTISWTSSPPTHATVGGTYQATATGGRSGNPVIVSIDASSTSGACAISSSGLVTFTGPGTCLVIADQAGDANYRAAPQAPQSVAVSAAVLAHASPSSGPLPLTGTPAFRLLTLAVALALVGIALIAIAGYRREHPRPSVAVARDLTSTEP
jgi:sugar lactone lactonase YvrE